MPLRQPPSLRLPRRPTPDGSPLSGPVPPPENDETADDGHDEYGHDRNNQEHDFPRSAGGTVVRSHADTP